MRMRTNVFRGLIASVLMASASVSLAARVAIIDSGVDYKHEAFAKYMWSNPNSSTTDDAGNVYKGDLHGWNFADKNNQVIDYKYLGTFSKDCYKIFEVQGKILRGIATEEEKAYYAAKKNDETFLKELGKFGNFVHGTHVSGISTDNSKSAEIVGLKLIPTETPGQKMTMPRDKASNPLVKLFLDQIAKQQATLLVQTAKYTKAVQARVANGSFGTSVAAVKPVVAQLVKQFGGGEPTEAELQDYSIGFVNSILKACEAFPAASPNTLFVFAAGNDGTDNDKLPTSPANIKANNTLSVAATLGTEKLASFSNYGAKLVDVAAPGVVIKSSIPGNEYLELSGTSMAAPFVTNAAARVQDANPTLDPAGVKRILIETVDKKAFLEGKVSSSGIVNVKRAQFAAELSAKKMTLDAAIAEARLAVGDELTTEMNVDESDLILAPMPAFFQ